MTFYGAAFRKGPILWMRLFRNASCLWDWERRYETGGIDALTPRRRGRPRSMPEPPISQEPQASQSDEAKSREELLAELNYLRKENAYLKNSRP
jgi:transposase